jgi:hypothetical protein
MWSTYTKKFIAILIVVFAISACQESGNNSEPGKTDDDTTTNDNNGGGTGNVDPEVRNPLTITGLTQSSYEWSTLSNGTKVYVDRSFTYSSIPEEYDGLRYLQTSNDDKNSTENQFLSFDVSRDVVVYVAYDERNTAIPAWLNNWVDTDQVLVNSDTSLHIYSKNFQKGKVILGGNFGSGLSMYTVIVDSKNDNDRDGMADDWETANGLDPTNPNDANTDTDGDGYTNISEFIGNSDPNDSNSVPDMTPVAQNDSVSIVQDTSIGIDVLDNDSRLLNSPISLSILSQPLNGAASVDSSQNLINYTPSAGYTGPDNLSYMITDSDGDSATASVNIQVNCSNGCAVGVSVTISWDPNPTNENVLNYQVFFGTSDVAESMVEIGQISNNPTALESTYDAGNELGLKTGDQACFRLRASNPAGNSPYSPAVCDII